MFARLLSPRRTCLVLALTFAGQAACTSSVSTLASYGVSGSITGLAGVVTIQNGADILRQAQDGTFTFPTGVAVGGSYNVTVLVQPAGQTCTLAAPTGNLPAGGITVAIVCTNDAPATYTVGGQLLGALGAGNGAVVLQDSAGQQLTLTAPGAFTFDTALAAGLSYAVSVVSAPQGIVCGVQAGSGTIQNANITSVVVTCSGQAVLTYTLGGQVIGATGPLLLSYAGEELTVSGNGNFVFQTTAVTNQAYTVAVSQSPQNQSCFIVGGAGTVATANVTNIEVTCGQALYTLGGSVTGLTSGALTLSAGAAGSRRITSNGDFTFATGLPTGTAWTVTATSQPSGQHCSIAYGMGTLGSASVTSIIVTCAPEVASLGGTVAGLNAGQSVELTNNGGDDIIIGDNIAFTFPTAVPAGQGYAVAVYLQPPGQHCSVAAGTGLVQSANITAVAVTCVDYAATATTQGAGARAVLGQPDFTSHDGASGEPNVLQYPSGNIATVGNTVFVPDTFNDRVTAYSGLPTYLGGDANAVWLAANFELASLPRSGPHAALNITAPAATASNGTNLAVATLSQVMLYNQAPTDGTQYPDVFLGGQTDCSAVNFGGGQLAVAAGGNVLVVADAANARVLVYSPLPTSNAAAPAFVLGQPDFVTCTQPTTTSANTLNTPGGVWTDGSNILVADWGNNRVLLWNALPTANGAPANAVLGQSSMTASAAGADTASFNFPFSVASNGVQIFVADRGNARVQVFEAFPASNGPAAGHSLGQPGPIGGTCNASGSVSAAGLCSPQGIGMLGGALLVVDTTNNRVLVY